MYGKPAAPFGEVAPSVGSDGWRRQGIARPILGQRILFYETRDQNDLLEIDERTAQLQIDLWSAVRVPATAQQTPVLALTLAGMNDVLNSQGYAQAIWWNRIPPRAWILMGAIAICSNLLVGYSTHGIGARRFRLPVLPFVLCIALFAVADIDSPRRGFIRVHPQNLISLVQSWRGR